MVSRAAWKAAVQYAGAPTAPLAVSAGRLVDLVVASQQAIDQLVIEMRDDGWTWAEVGDALGVSTQAAHRRYRTVTK